MTLQDQVIHDETHFDTALGSQHGTFQQHPAAEIWVPQVGLDIEGGHGGVYQRQPPVQAAVTAVQYAKAGIVVSMFRLDAFCDIGQNSCGRRRLGETGVRP